MSKFNVYLEYEILFNKSKDKIIKIADSTFNNSSIFTNIYYYCVESTEFIEPEELVDIHSDGMLTYVELKINVLETWILEDESTFIEILEVSEFIEKYIIPKYKLSKKERPKKVCRDFEYRKNNTPFDIFNLSDSITDFPEMEDNSSNMTHLLFEVWSSHSYEGDYNFLGEVGKGLDYELVKNNG